MEEQTLNSTNSEEQDVSSPEGEEDVQHLDNSDSLSGKEELPIEKLSKITGRDFKSIDDFQKHYKELTSFIGKNPKELEEKARAYDRMLEEDKRKLEAAQDNSGGGKIKDFSFQNEEVQALKSKIEEMELLKDNPESSKILDTIRAVAKSRNVSLKEAYESDLKDLLQSKLNAERQQEREKNASIESKSRISQSKVSKLSGLVDAIKRQDTDEAKESLVREFLSE